MLNSIPETRDFEGDEQIVRTGLCARPCYRPKCAVFPPLKGFTNIQIRILAAPIGDCDYLLRVSFLYAIALPFTVLLLVFRVVCVLNEQNAPVAARVEQHTNGSNNSSFNNNLRQVRLRL